MWTGLQSRVAVLALVVALLTVPVAGAQLGGLAQEQVDPDTVVLQVDLQEDGDTRWTVSYRTRLDDDNTTEAFRSLQDDVDANPDTYTADFGDRMGRTVATAENATGREMTLRNLTVTAETEALPQEYGVVTYRFEWTNFAAVEGEQLRAGDAISGLFLDSESTLRITWPDGYERASVDPSPTRNDETSVAWDGRLDFGSDEPRVVVSPADAGGQTTTTGEAADGDGNAWLLVVATLLAASGVVALLWVNRRYGFTDGGSGNAATADDAAPDTDDTAAGGAAAAGSTADADGAGDDEDGTASPPPELLSNEERVLQLLDDNAGRMKQQQVAEQLDWTAAKTSQVIGDLRDEDRLETFRIGRENVVTLPDVDVAGDLGSDGDSEHDES